jgi:hypothetical protein
MAESIMSESLDVTRSQLRKCLFPDAQTEACQLDADGDHFPRSKVMRFAFNPRNRQLLMFSGSILAVLMSRVAGANAIGVLMDTARSLARQRKV